MAVKIKLKNGKEGLLLNPSEKSKKFATELKHGVKMTNDGQIKSKDGEAVTLTPTQKAFRSGYLKSRSDGSKALKAKTKNSSQVFGEKLNNASMKRFKKPYNDLTDEQRVSILHSTGVSKELTNT